MKRLFVSAVGILASLVFGVQALAADYSGSGSWKDNGGNSGEFTATVSGEDTDAGMTITKTITVGDTTKTFSFAVNKVDDTWFKINIDGQNVGGGYCWYVDVSVSEETAGKICHYGLNVGNGVMVEETFKKFGDQMFIMGHKWDPNSKLAITWQGVLSAGDSSN